MMKQFLTVWRSKVKELIANSLVQPVQAMGIEAGFTLQLGQLEEQWQQALDALLASKQREAVVIRQLQQLQQLCSTLLDEIQHVQCSEGGQSAILQPLGQLLLRLLMRLLDNHGQYCDWQQQPPAIYVAHCWQTLAKQHLVFVAVLKQKQPNEVLQVLLLAVFNQSDTVPITSFGQLAYLMALQPLLINFCKKVNNEPFEEALVAYLIYLNFNHEGFILWLRQELDNQQAEQLSPKAQYEFLCQKEKYMACLATRNTTAFNQAQESAKTQILAFLGSCLLYHHRMMPSIALPTAKVGELPLSPYRLRCNLSVDALAYLIRLLIEADVLVAQPRSQLLNFIAKHFQTAGIGDELLSANSLGIKYKQVVQRTALNVRSLLKKMTKIVDANFNS